MSTVVDLAALGSSGFVIEGASEYDQAGFSVSNAGDVNGDGFDDIIVGAPTAAAEVDGRAYVLFGRAGGFGTVDLADLDPADGFAIEGADFEYAGWEVSDAGDINGDGFDDLMVGTPSGGYYYGGLPTAYVIFGTSAATGTVDLENLSPSRGFVIEGGDIVYGYGGLSLSAAGDVNGDGFDDLIVGDLYGGDNPGAAYVIFGKATGLGPVALNDLDASDGFAIVGDATFDWAGNSVAGAGDVNGDGFDDIVIGADGSDRGGQDAGAAYVLFGKAGGFATVDLGNLAPAAGFLIQGNAAGDQAGSSVSSAGDVNGDGFDDVIVGAFPADIGGSNAGAAYVIFGKAGGFGTIDLSSIGSGEGFIIRGDAADDFAGFSVSAAGDVNADGFDDVIIGAHGGGDGGADAGEAYVIFGKAGGFGSIDLSNLDPADGFILEGQAAGERAGHSVSGAGDLNNDGFADIIVGAPGNGNAGNSAGAAYVIFGVVPTAAVTRIGSAADQTIRGGSGDDFLDGREGDDSLFGAGGNDRLFGRAGNDLLDGGSASDILSGEGGDDILFGLQGNDRLHGGMGVDRMHGGVGDDVYIVSDATDFALERASEGIDKVFSTVSLRLRLNVEHLTLRGTSDITGVGNELANTVVGNAGSNRLYGRAGDDRLHGGDSRDALLGEAGSDFLSGDGGADWLEGGAGRDHFVGGSGADRFGFRDGDFSGTTAATADRIHDFNDAEGDRIRLDFVDANTSVGGDQDFTFRGTGAFTGTAGELRYQQIGGNTYVQGDTNGDGTADFWIRLDGLHTLASDDIIF